MPVPTQLTPKGLARFNHFELVAHSVVEGFMTGLHKSPYKGFAIEFAEHRPYTPGDDIKHLDWKLYAKLDRYYIRQYEEDTSLRAYLLLDRSGSMGYRSGRTAKIDFGRYICGVFTYLLQLQQDAIGLVTFDSRVEHHLPPRSTRTHMKAIFDRLTATQCGRDTNLGGVLHSLADRLKRRALVVIVSDLFDDSQAIIRALNHFSHRRHEVVVFQVLDRREVTFPFVEQTRFESLEQVETILTDPLRVRREYQRQFNDHQTAIRKACHRLRIDFQQLLTDEPFERQMAAYLAGRLRR